MDEEDLTKDLEFYKQAASLWQKTCEENARQWHAAEERAKALERSLAEQQVRLDQLLKNANVETGRLRQMARELQAFKAKADLSRVATALRKFRDIKGDDRCYKDLYELYCSLPEGYTPEPEQVGIDLNLCAAFKRSEEDPRVKYVSPQRRIEQLEAEIVQLRFLMKRIASLAQESEHGKKEALTNAPASGNTPGTWANLPGRLSPLPGDPERRVCPGDSPPGTGGR